MSSNTRIHSAALERESAEIRADMDATLAALERKLSPGQLVDRSMDLLREHGGEFAANFGRQVRENPVPFVLAAAGIAWLMAANNAPRQPYAAEERDTEGSSPGIAQQLGSAAAQSSTHGVQGVHERFRHRTEQVREQAGAAKDRVRSAAHQTRERAHQAKDNFVTLLDEQPVAVGAMGVALGALLGAIMPSSRVEDQLFGPRRDQALDKAKEMGARRYESLRSQANDVADRAKDTTRHPSGEGASARRDESVGST